MVFLEIPNVPKGTVLAEKVTYKCDRIQLSSYRDTRVENGNLAVPVNNTLMRHISFLAADT